jgi:hypothetical protein
MFIKAVSGVRRPHRVNRRVGETPIYLANHRRLICDGIRTNLNHLFPQPTCLNSISVISEAR